jgi:K+-transporting ATPase KdpF subunit
MSTPDYENSLPEFEPYHARFFTKPLHPATRSLPGFCSRGTSLCGLSDLLQDRLENRRGLVVHRGDRRVSAADVGTGGGLRRAGAQTVTWIYVLSAIISAALLVYLVVALIRAEDL